MSDYLPYLKDKPFYQKIIALLLLMAISLVLMMVIGLVIAIPFWGIGILENFSQSIDYTSEVAVSFLKYFQVVNQIGVFILPVICFAYFENRNVGSYLRINRRPGGALLIVAIIMFLASIPAVNWMIGINEKMHLPDFMAAIEEWMRSNEDNLGQLTEAFMKTNTFTGLFVNLFIIGFLAALGEEFLFRGVILRLFFDWSKNVHIAVFVSAIIFSAFHLQFFGFLPRVFLGILLGYAFISSGTLWTPIILHFIFNGIAVVAAFSFERGWISTDMEEFGSTENPIIISLSLLLSLMLLFFLYRKGASHPDDYQFKKNTRNEQNHSGY
jgi:membrane protease YdiL (CAAX protease family)